ncbi:MAG: phosphotransferase family protein [Acidimicrobiales bacterium]
MAFADTYSQPDAPDPILSDEVVLDLARRHVPSVARVALVDETGGEARAYMCDDVVVKTQRPHRLRPRTSLEKEAFILDQLASSPGLAVPRVLGYGREGDVEYLVMTRIPGMKLEDSTLTGPARTAVLEEVGATLRQLHDIDQSAMRASDLIPGDSSPAGLRDRLAAVFEDMIAMLGADPRWNDEIDLSWIRESCLDGLSGETEPVTLHSNPGPEHCFVDPGSLGLTGLIDFGDAYRSHPGLDVRSWMSLEDSRNMLDGYRHAGPVGEDFLHVWKTGIILTELRLASRGYREPEEASSLIRELII